MAIGTSGAVLLLLGLLRMVAATLPVHHGQAKDILGKILADRKAARRPFRLRTQSGRLLLQDAKPERTQAERNACSNDSVVLSSNFVTRRFKEEHAILEEIDFLRRFGTLELLDGDTESPVGRVESAALLRSVVQHQKTVWVIENQLYALNHILGLRRKYGILDDISLVFMTTYAFGFNASKQVTSSVPQPAVLSPKLLHVECSQRHPAHRIC